jgi:hypothetical protein
MKTDELPKIILAGGTGFLGLALAKHFNAAGYSVVILTRLVKANCPWQQVQWDGRTLGAWTAQLEGAVAVVNLCGKSVDCRYNAENRRPLIHSRTEPTAILGQAIAQCQQPPTAWLNASTATIYRHNLSPKAWDESCTDYTAESEAKDAFSIEIAQAWEAAFNSAETPRTRKIILRTAMVLGHGSNSVYPVLCRMARLGLGGTAATGKQYVSWVHEEDFCRIIEFLICRTELNGIFNIAAPNALTNATMMKHFRQHVRMPLGLPAARWMLELGAFFLRTETELILKSRHVYPARLIQNGFQFHFPTFAEALENLGKVLE